jgi:mRNA-degrading endonuclease toxin of MazEF toxin-antitoxin module
MLLAGIQQTKRRNSAMVSLDARQKHSGMTFAVTATRTKAQVMTAPSITDFKYATAS